MVGNDRPGTAHLPQDASAIYRMDGGALSPHPVARPFQATGLFILKRLLIDSGPQSH